MQLAAGERNGVALQHVQQMLAEKLIITSLA
jgi:hypothetical protein